MSNSRRSMVKPDLWRVIRALRRLCEKVMKMHYDEKSDALYLRLDESKIIESEEVQPGIVLDYNDNKQVVGVEILRVKERVPLADLKHLDFKVA